MVLDSETGSFTYTHDQKDNLNDSFIYEVTDGTNTVQQTATITIELENPTLPTMCGAPVTSVMVDADYYYDPQGNTADQGETYTYSTTNPLPDWLSIDPSTGVISGTPDSGDVSVRGRRCGARDRRPRAVR